RNYVALFEKWRRNPHEFRKSSIQGDTKRVVVRAQVVLASHTRGTTATSYVRCNKDTLAEVVSLLDSPAQFDAGPYHFIARHTYRVWTVLAMRSFQNAQISCANTGVIHSQHDLVRARRRSWELLYPQVFWSVIDGGDHPLTPRTDLSKTSDNCTLRSSKK